MTAGGSDENHVNYETLDGPYTLMDAGDYTDPPNDLQPSTPATKEHPGRSSDMDCGDEAKGDNTSEFGDRTP